MEKDGVTTELNAMDNLIEMAATIERLVDARLHMVLPLNFNKEDLANLELDSSQKVLAPRSILAQTLADKNQEIFQRLKYIEAALRAVDLEPSNQETMVKELKSRPPIKDLSLIR